MPTCAAKPAPKRSMASITSTTGTTVQAVALSTESHHTAPSSVASTDQERSTANWAIQKRHATQLASPTSRSAPRRRTSSPL